MKAGQQGGGVGEHEGWSTGRSCVAWRQEGCGSFGFFFVCVFSVEILQFTCWILIISQLIFTCMHFCFRH